MNNNYYFDMSKMKHEIASISSNNVTTNPPTKAKKNNITEFYQITSYPSPKTNTHHLRKFKINKEGEIIEEKNYQITQKQFEKFIKVKNANEYKCYACFNLKNVGYPKMGEILMAQSNILSNNHDYTGYAKF